jgi:MFS family permease
MMRFLSRELARWGALEHPARLYLAHVTLLTTGLAAPQLFFNLAVLAQGHGREFLGVLNTVAVVTAAALSLPLWLGVNRFGLRRALVVAAALQSASALLFGLAADRAWLIASAVLAGVAAVLFQVVAAPFMMRYSTAATRDHLFSAASAVAIGVSGLATLAAGPLPGLLGRLIDATPQSAAAYQACFVLSAVLLALAVIPLLKAEGTTLNAEPKDERTTLNAAGILEEDAEQAAAEVPPHRSNTTGIRLQPFSVQRSAFSARRSIQRSVFSLHPSAFSLPKQLPQLLIPPLLVSCGAALLIPYLNLFFAERYRIGNVALGVIFAAFDIATGVALLAGPALSRRIGKMPTVALTRALALPFTLLIGFAPGLGLAAGAALVRVVLFNMAAPLYDAAALERTDEQARPLMVGLLGAAYSAGYLAGPLISVWVQERYGFAPLFVATTLIYALSVAAVWWFFVRPSATK